MKEVQKKDVPEISGGQTSLEDGGLPWVPLPSPGFPPNPGMPGDPLDPLGDAISKNQVQS